MSCDQRTTLPLSGQQQSAPELDKSFGSLASVRCLERKFVELRSAQATTGAKGVLIAPQSYWLISYTSYHLLVLQSFSAPVVASTHNLLSSTKVQF